MAALSVIGPGFIATIVVSCVLLWLLTVVARRRRRRVLTVAAGLFATLMTLATAADAANVYFEYMPRVGDVIGTGSWPTAPATAVDHEPVRRTAHRVHRAVAVAPVTAQPVGSAAAVGSVGATALPVSPPPYPRGVVVPLPVAGTVSGLHLGNALVYLPPQYFSQPQRRFPAVYLLHGSPGVPVDWLRGGGAADAGAAVAGVGSPTIIVMPQVSRWWLDDSECVNGQRETIETYLLSDVVPTVDARVRTLPRRELRAVAGMSAGGYCALNLGLRHREAFSLILDMSGLTRPTRHGGMKALFGRRGDLAAVVAENSPAEYAAGLAPQPSTAVWLDSGSSDGEVLPGLRSMAATLTARGIPATLHLRPGSHTFHVWRPALRDTLIWASARMAAAAAGG